jgi:hypothetical protein
MLNWAEAVGALTVALVRRLGLNKDFFRHVCAVKISSSLSWVLSLLGRVAHLVMGVSCVRSDYFLADVWRERVVLERFSWVSLENDGQPSINVT